MKETEVEQMEPMIVSMTPREVTARATPIAPATRSDVEKTMAHKMVNDHFPNILLEKVKDEIWEALPKVYVARLIASHLAAGIVYREGISFFASMEPDVVAKTAATYMCKEQEIEHLVDAVESSGIPDAKRIAGLLRRGGTRASLSDH